MHSIDLKITNYVEYENSGWLTIFFGKIATMVDYLNYESRR